MSRADAQQLSLLGHDRPAFHLPFPPNARRELGHGAWIDQVQSFLSGHETVFTTLRDDTRWHTHRRLMYDRMVEVPRLTATLPRDGPGHPIIRDLAGALGKRYGVTFDTVSMALYRDGHDSVAWHRDKGRSGRWPYGVVAIVSVGAPRRFLLRPYGGGESVALSAGWGDLLVMGGSCQLTWEHCVPKVNHADSRLSVMFRHSADFSNG